MLDVKVNGRSLDLGEFSISFELLSPVFNDIGSFSYPFTFPATAKNKSILGFHNRVNNNQVINQKTAVELYLNGLIWKRGNLMITEGDRDNFKANFTISEGYFYQTIKEKKLADLDFGGNRSYSPEILHDKIFKSYPEVDFTRFPVLMRNFYVDSGINTKQVETIELWGNSGKLLVSETGELEKTIMFVAALNITASNFVTANAEAYFAKGIVLTSSEHHIIFTSKVSGVGFSKPLVTSIEPNISGTVISSQTSTRSEMLNATFFGRVNYYDLMQVDFSPFPNTIVIFPFLNYVLDAIFNFNNISISKNIFRSDIFLRQLVLLNNNTINYWSGGDNLTGGIMGYFNIKDYVPDLTFTDFFSFLNTIFKSYLFYNDLKNEASICCFKDIINAPQVQPLNNPYKIIYLKPNEYDGFEMSRIVDSSDSVADEFYKDFSGFNYKGQVANLESLPTVGISLDIFYVQDLAHYYYWELSFDASTGQWKRFAHGRLNYWEGNKKLKIEIDNAIAQESSSYPPNLGNKGQWQIINTPFQFLERPAARLMFFHGKIMNSPFGSPFNKDNYGNTLPGYSLEWEGETGIREIFYKDFLEFQKNTREAEISMILKPAQLKVIDFSSKYRFAEANWLISSIKFTVSNDKISPATIVAFKV